MLNTKVHSRDGTKVGVVRGRGYRCQLEGCRGLRLPVRWPDGRMTFPCTKGMTAQPDGSLKID